MSKTTGIGWTDSTANAVIGCSGVSLGCVNCYAEVDTPARVHRHRGRETWGAKGERIPVASFEKNMLAMNRKPWICPVCGHAMTQDESKGYLGCPAKTEEEKGCFGANRIMHFAQHHRRRIFADSNSDWLDDRWPVETLAHFLDVIRQCDQCVIQLLTKRPENFMGRMREVLDFNWKAWKGDHRYWVTGPFHQWLAEWQAQNVPPKHIWIGVSCENQQRADERVPELLKIPAAVRFLSCEPLLGRIDLGYYCDEPDRHIDHQFWSPGIRGGISWVIVGAESGPKRRAMELEWLADIVEQCKAAEIPCYVKQDNALKPGQQGRITDELWHIRQFPCS